MEERQDLIRRKESVAGLIAKAKEEIAELEWRIPRVPATTARKIRLSLPQRHKFLADLEERLGVLTQALDAMDEQALAAMGLDNLPAQ